MMLPFLWNSPSFSLLQHSFSRFNARPLPLFTTAFTHSLTLFSLSFSLLRLQPYSHSHAFSPLITPCVFCSDTLYSVSISLHWYSGRNYESWAVFSCFPYLGCISSAFCITHLKVCVHAQGRYRVRGFIYIYAFSRRFYPKVPIQAIHFLSVCVFPGNWPPTFCAANAMLYHWATGTPFHHLWWTSFHHRWEQSKYTDSW